MLVQPENTDPASATAVSVTGTGGAYCSEQSPGQSIPAGTLVTRPLPPEESSKVTDRIEGIAVVAITDFVPSIVIVQTGPVPLQAPAHPRKTKAGPVTTFKVTVVPAE